MFGLFVNIYLIIISMFVLTASYSFWISSSAPRYLRNFTFFLGLSIFLTCFNYALMGFMPKLEYAFIFRFIGLFGIEAFLILELLFLFYELKIPASIKYIFSGFILVYAFFDLLIYGNKKVLKFVRNDYYNSFQIIDKNCQIFHFIYLFVIAATLFSFAIIWYKKKTLEREKHISRSLILWNLFILIAAIPNFIKTDFFEKYPTFLYCTAFFFLFNVWIVTVKKRSYYMLSSKTISREVFDAIDIPVFIFDVNGKVNEKNTCAQREFNLSEQCDYGIRDLFSISDVELLRIIAKAKHGENSRINTTVKSNGKTCLLKFSAKLDFVGEPFCIITSVEFI